jgi:lycopene beta-cyclase
MGKKKYDYIIAGAGAAGISLLFYILKQKELSNKSILIIDKEEKNTNDRTWCFWQKEENPFENIIYRKWDKLFFHTKSISKKLNINPYQYKMLKGKDFYDFGKNLITDNKNVSWICEEVKSISENGILKTENQEFEAEYIFSSVPITLKKENQKHELLQHFKGWFIRTRKSKFNPNEATLMDFRVPQNGDCRFVYVLPFNENEALVEYTVFSKEILNQDIYNTELRNYINNYLQIDDFEIEHEEFGIIPMTTAHFEKRIGKRTINIGTIGGNTKASTGYTFEFIQRNCKKIAENLSKNKDPLYQINKLKKSKYALYDAVFLRVLSENKIDAYSVFEDMFKKLAADLPLKFLDEKTNFLEDLKVMYSVDTKVFLKATISEIISTKKR